MTGNRLDGSTATIREIGGSVLALTDSQRTTNPRGHK